MRDHELYATILGLTAPWTVERVDADFLGGAVHVWLARTDGAPAQCPECQTTCPIYDHREREWRHLDTCQLQTRLHARVPRVECPTHGVLQSPIPWATPGSKFTLLFERLAIDWLREAAVPAVARQLGLGWDAVWGIERRAVARGLERRGTLMLRYVGVDEKSFQRRYDFVTVVSDLERARSSWPTTANGRAWKRSGPWASPMPNAARLRPSRWTCGCRTCRPPARRSPGPTRRSLRPLSLCEASQRGRRSRAPGRAA